MVAASEATVPTWLVTASYVTGAIVALGAIIGFFWRKIVKPLARIEHAMPILLEIADEFKPNGGGSLRDTVNRIETASTTAAHKAEHVATALATHDAWERSERRRQHRRTDDTTTKENKR